MDFIFDSGLVLYLPLYERDGSSFMSKDAYGHLYTVTGALWTPRGRSFDGSDDYVTIPDHAAFDIATKLTFLSWVKSDVVASVADQDYIASKYATDEREWAFRTLNTGVLAIYFGDPNDGSFEGRVESDVAHITSTTTYYLVGFTFSSGTVVLYVNGAAVDSSTATGAVPATLYNGSADILIGNTADLGVGQFWDGLQGEVWLYSRALTFLEIQHIYLATKWRYR